MDIPDLFPTAAGDSRTLELASGRAFLIHCVDDGWTFIEEQTPTNNGSLTEYEGRWMVVVQRGGTNDIRHCESWPETRSVMLDDRT